MIDADSPTPERRLVATGHEVDIVDGVLAVAVDQIDQPVADTLDRRDIEFHRPDLDLHRLGAKRTPARRPSPHPPRGTRSRRRRPMRRAKAARTNRFPVDDEIDVALAIERHVLGTVAGHGAKSHALEQCRSATDRAGIFDEFEAVGADRVVPKIAFLAKSPTSEPPTPLSRLMWSARA